MDNTPREGTCGEDNGTAGESFAKRQTTPSMRFLPGEPREATTLSRQKWREIRSGYHRQQAAKRARHSERRDSREQAL
jgi:hypothetical protein